MGARSPVALHAVPRLSHVEHMDCIAIRNKAVRAGLLPLSAIGGLESTLTGQSAVMGEWLESDAILTFGTSSLDLYVVLPDLPWSHADDCLHRGSGGDRKDISPISMRKP
ncbi:MAG: hypothetical protein EA424_02205 [Planctomycetaceae bacterium]|nr:MAG: hypothetical protein EA424_02205 [Planctomycetaceae bacterium]